LTSPFLSRSPDEWVASNELAFAIHDAFPVSPGHTLVVPRRLIATWFEATPEEQAALFALVEVVRRQLEDGTPRPDGYNIGINVGAAGGQTVPHLHVHVIPRYQGDVDDPRGGVRHVIPGKGNYLTERPRALATGSHRDPFLGHLRPLLEQAQQVAIVAAFVQASGLELIREIVLRRLAQGARFRLVTGDYLNITQVAALENLLDWSRTQSGFEARVVETGLLDRGTQSFHPKSWRFEGPGLGAAFVGSSNLSRSALTTGVEWNLRMDRGDDPAAYRQVLEAFEKLWLSARPLDTEWVRAYAERVRASERALPTGEMEPEDAAPPPPHALQAEGLAALAGAREACRARALVVMATGLGKTWLAAFDVAAFWEERGHRPRVLFLAHRVELLLQAAATFRRLYRQRGVTPEVGFFVGDRDELATELVFASVQKLALPSNRSRLAQFTFDYVVVDEVHHATAASYRAVLDYLRADFTLGLTATPDRADEADVLGIFDDHLAYRADLWIGIQAGLLAPFAYHGVRDDIDYDNIPWRNHRFDPERLAEAAQTQARMERLWEAWQRHPASRTLVFCCSIAHARFVCDWLKSRGVQAVVVDGDTRADDRAKALEDLRVCDGPPRAVCAVDLFNEGIDVPEIDRVVMLRPTESGVVFLQQLGRGLRRSEDKDQLCVIDFVGNHRIFMERIRLLASLGGRTPDLRAYLTADTPLQLPPGCSVDIQLEAKDLLRGLLPTGPEALQGFYQRFRETHDRRPTAGELYRLGYRPSVLGGWYEFLASEEDLTTDERRVWEAGRAWFHDLERTALEKCFKLVLLEVLLANDGLLSGLELATLAERSREYLLRSPELVRDITGVRELGDPREVSPGTWAAYWQRNPIAAWCRAHGGRWFRVEGERFLPSLPVPAGLEDVFSAMTRELLDYRLAMYRARTSLAAGPGRFTCKVLWNQRDPILKLPGGAGRAGAPTGETDVRLPDGSPWVFRFMREFCNVARPAGTQRNALPDRLRQWFGPSAGRPGTAFHVTFTRSPDGWWVEPVETTASELADPGTLPFYSSLKAAAGVGQMHEDVRSAEAVQLPVGTPDPGAFAVRALGRSMDGGPRPIHDGDWLVMRWARGTPLASITDRVALIENSEGLQASYQVKRVVSSGEGWLLASDNPAYPPQQASESTAVVATLRQVIRPEALAPEPGVLLPESELSPAFGFTVAPRTGRQMGHLFVFAEGQGLFTAPDRLALAVTDRQPAETAYILAREGSDGDWLYCGVGRWQDAEDAWEVPDLDYVGWRALGSGRSASRRLPPAFLEAASSLVEGWLRDRDPAALVEGAGKRIRLVGRAAQGGVKIDGGPGGFAERTVTLTDIAWVLAARADVDRSGGLLDEARVNRQRYLVGTPRASTRWIDTGWALFLLTALGGAA
jgi:superfamily II DNA or RNA helicase/diadenosine tetraphosphate (Ap4A) HIT family hydrolase/SOS-response transcriptional repressor LexA